MMTDHQTALLVSELRRFKATRMAKIEIVPTSLSPAITVRKVIDSGASSPHMCSLSKQPSIEREYQRKGSESSVKSSPVYATAFDHFTGHPTSHFYSEEEDKEEENKLQRRRRQFRRKPSCTFYTKQDFSAPVSIDCPHVGTQKRIRARPRPKTVQTKFAKQQQNYFAGDVPTPVRDVTRS